VVDPTEQARRLTRQLDDVVNRVRQRDVRQRVGTRAERVADGGAERRQAARVVGEQFLVAAGGRAARGGLRRGGAVGGRRVGAARGGAGGGRAGVCAGGPRSVACVRKRGRGARTLKWSDGRQGLGGGRPVGGGACRGDWDRHNRKSGCTSGCAPGEWRRCQP